MSARLELLVSPPGTGKTTVCIDLFKQELLKSRGGIDSRSYFVLPSREHASRIQSLILRKDVPGRRSAGAPMAGLFNAHVLTIGDLAEQALEGVSAGRPAESIRRAAVAEALAATDERGESLYKVFRDSLELPGFHELLLESVREFKSSLLSTAEFEKRAAVLLKDPVFRAKFRDFSIFVKRYDAKLESLGLSEPDDDLAKLGSLERSRWKPELVIFDGFYRFSHAQKKLLTLVAERASRAVVTLTLDPLHPAGEALFAYAEHTRRFLVSAGFSQVDLPAENHRTRDRGLRHLAAQVFSPSPKRYDGVAPITVLSAPSLRSEYETVAREIRKLYRESTLHFSDFCVILRAVSGQKAIIESVFSEYEVPVAIHERNRLTDSGLAAALYRFLRLPVENWKRDDVFALAKSSYFRRALSLERAIEIERAALREGLLEGREGWARLADSTELDSQARAFLSSLLDAEAGLLSARNVHALAAAVDAFLAPLSTGDAAATVLDAVARRSMASILASARRRYVDGRESFDAARCARETLTAVEGGLFSLKAPGRNRVQVYDAVMALPKEYRVVFVSDLLEKSFPQPVTEDPLFKDAERRAMNGADPVFEERGSRLSGERYFFYMALTRARERLYLTHSTHDSDGKPTLGSFFIDEALRCFGERAVEHRRRDLSQFLPEPAEWESDGDVARGISEGLARGGRHAEFARALKSAWAAPEAYAKPLSRSAVPAGFRDPRVKKTLESLRGPFSASSVETFLTCPFRHFAERVLRLNVPLEGREDALMGDLLHKTLYEYFAETLSEADRASGAYLKDPERMTRALRVILDKHFEAGPFRGEPRYRRIAWHASMARMLDRYVELERDLAGGTKPSRFEFGFGDGKTDYLRISDKSGEILMKGFIDRIDTGPSGDEAFVIDYKKSSRNLAKKLKNGEEIQLPLYLLAAQRLLKLKPAGLEHRILKTGTQESPDLDPKEIEDLLAQTEERIRGAVRKIRSGDIAVEPRDCAFCEFDAVCRVEAKKGHEH